MISRSLYSRKRVLWLGGGASLLGLLVASFVWGVDPEPSKLVAAASLNQSRVRLADVNCLSIEPAHVVFNKTIYDDSRLVELIAKSLSIEKISFDTSYSACHWGMRISGEEKRILAVRYDGMIARALVSLGICERKSDGRMNPDMCLSKNIYVFSPRVEVRDLMAIALEGLAMQQVNEWIAFKKGRL